MLVRKEINFKSNLIEWSQKNKISISFDLIESFTDHDGNPVFQSAIKLLGEQIGIGIGYSKKESQQAASKMAVKRLRTDKELQQRISATKKKKTGELTDEKEFSTSQRKKLYDKQQNLGTSFDIPKFLAI